MPVETILFPSGDGAGDFIAVGGPSAKWKTVNSGITAPFDSTYLRVSGVELSSRNMTQVLGLEDLPKYFNTIDTISGIVRLRVDNQADDYDLTLQFFEGDGTTALTYPSGKSHSSGGLFAASEDTFKDHVFDFDVKRGNNTTPCEWQDALLKITVSCSETTSELDISEIQLGLYHTSGDSCFYTDCENLGASGACCYYEDGSSKILSWLTQADCLSQYPYAVWTSGAPSSGVNVVCHVPTATGWNCLDPDSTTSDRCIEQQGGVYSTQAECLSACVPSWNCVDGSCVQDMDGGGTYSSQSACESACWYYKCDLPTETCTQAADGTYSTIGACVAACNTTTTTTTESPDCCNWDGNGTVRVTGICDFTIDANFTESPDNTWCFNGTSSCGDILQICFLCDPTEDLGPDKWSLISNDMPCADSMTFTGENPTTPICDEAPTFNFEISASNTCSCCEGCCEWDGLATVSLAGPSGVYLDPNSDVSKVGWSLDDSYTKVNDGVRAPQSALAPEIYSSSDGDTIVFGTESVPAIPATSTAVSILLYTSQTEGSGVNLMWNGAWQGKKIHDERESPGPGGEWDKYKWDVNTDLSAGVSNIQMEIINGPGGDGDDTAVRAAYIEVEYYCNEDDPHCPYCSFTEQIQFTSCGENCWSYGGEVSCGDTINMTVGCDTTASVSDPAKWSITNFSRSCSTPTTPSTTGILSNPEQCNEPPVFYGEWADSKDCECCDEHCCDWDGTGAKLEIYTGTYGASPLCYAQYFTMTKISDHVWEFDGQLSDGEDFYLKVSCDGGKDVGVDWATKWTVLSSSLPCAENFAFTSTILTAPTCDNPPVFLVTADNYDNCNGSTC